MPTPCGSVVISSKFVTPAAVLTKALIKIKQIGLLRHALRRGMSVCETDFVFFLKTLIINSSPFIENSSELIGRRSELISTIAEQI